MKRGNNSSKNNLVFIFLILCTLSLSAFSLVANAQNPEIVYKSTPIPTHKVVKSTKSKKKVTPRPKMYQKMTNTRKNN